MATEELKGKEKDIKAHFPKKIDLDSIQKEGMDFIDEHGVVEPIADAITRNKNLFVTGETGGGKSSLVIELLNKSGWGYETLNFNSKVTIGAIVGKVEPDSKTGGWIWHDGPLTRCMKEGKVFIGEEANGMTSETSLCLHSPMDFRRELVLSKDGGVEVIKAHENFRIVLTGNLGYRGTEKLSPALQSRIGKSVDVPYLSVELEAQLLMKRVGIDKDTARAMCNVASAVRANRDKSGFRPLSTRTMLEWADDYMHAISQKAGKKEAMVAAEYTIIPTLADAPADREIVRQFVKRTFSSKKYDEEEDS